MQYYCATFFSEGLQQEGLVAYLGDAGFEMFQQEQHRLEAYIPVDGLTLADLESVIRTIPGQLTGEDWKIEVCPEKNWNEEWEKSFSPVTVQDRIIIRAPFHPAPENATMLDIVIEPKMSFGTGHHPTTELMMTAMLDLDFNGKSVIDMGCGSGILSILAHKSGAKTVLGIDIDDWAVENSIENCQRNGCEAVRILKGNVTAAGGHRADILLANINRNILLHDMVHYTGLLDRDGTVFMSGFLVEDQAVLTAAASACGMIPMSSLVNNGWMMLSFQSRA